MNNRRFALLLGAVIIAFALTFFFTDFVEAFIIIPVAYIFWMLGIVYRLIPQQIYWFAILVGLIYAFVVYFIQSTGNKFDDNKSKYNRRGQVEILAGMIENRRKGVYFKWTLAHLMGEVAAYLLSSQDRRISSKPLRGRGWNPPAKIDAYLDAGLNKSFADYPRAGFFSSAPKTPFDIELEPVVEFLESEMEIEDDHIA
jgi:membrane protein implicated in regulation of membrane protease activity